MVEDGKLDIAQDRRKDKGNPNRVQPTVGNKQEIMSNCAESDGTARELRKRGQRGKIDVNEKKEAGILASVFFLLGPSRAKNAGGTISCDRTQTIIKPSRGLHEGNGFHLILWECYGGICTEEGDSSRRGNGNEN